MHLPDDLVFKLAVQLDCWISFKLQIPLIHLENLPPELFFLLEGHERYQSASCKEEGVLTMGTV